MTQLPISTQWLINSTGQIDTNLALSVVLIFSPRTGSKGTGWLCSNQHVVTNEHVVNNASSSEIVIIFPDGKQLQPVSKIEDSDVDLAVLTLPNPVPENPLKIKIDNVDVGSKICAWGHPLGYNGPSPILSVGYVAGYSQHVSTSASAMYRRVVLNAALNPGNSGGPILVWGEDSVCGVAVTKHAPISQPLQARINALADNKSGLQFSGHDAQGVPINFSESQIVADVLKYFQNMTQVVLGEAISSNDVVCFLNSNSIPWVQA